MAIRYPQVLSIATGPLIVRWTDRETMLYALALGYGAGPDDLAYVYECPPPRVVPSFAAILITDAFPSFAAMGIDPLMLVHGEQTLTVHQPLLSAGEAIATGRIVHAFDKGDKGAVVVLDLDLALPGGAPAGGSQGNAVRPGRR